MEIWKDIPDYEGVYQVSNYGNVRSLAKKIIRNDGKPLYVIGRILKPSINKGYLQVKLYKENNKKTFKIHILVAKTFLNYEQTGTTAGLVVDHINEDKADNRVGNLQIITNRENVVRSLKKNSSSYTGVTWNKNANKWASQITIKGHHYYLGLFKCEFAAHVAYQKKLVSL